MRAMIALLGLLSGTAAAALTPALPPSLVITNGMIYDGLGGAPYKGWLVVSGDRITNMGAGDLPGQSQLLRDARQVVDAHGLAVAPGFVNMLSWSTESLIADGRALSDIKQGITLEVMGEGESMGPLSPALKAYALKQQSDVKYPITWTTLGEYLAFLERRGIAPNVASFVGATTVREDVVGFDDIDPTPAQLDQMRRLVRQAMNEGAVGLGSSLIYAPASYAKTPELIALATESAKCGGMYISHMRSEGDRLVEAVDELIEIARRSGGPAEIYHLKQAGQSNWGKLDTVIARVEAARASGVRITADMYNYTAGATGLDAAMPTWVQAGGYDKWAERLRDPAIRARVLAEMKQPGKDWENLMLATGSPDRVLLLGFKNPKLKPLTGKTLSEVAKLRGKTPEETAIDLVIEDGSRVGTAYFLMDEANVVRQIGLPWVAFGSDAEGSAPEGVFLQSSTHPRAYGNVAKLLGHYVRDQKATTLQDAVRRLTSFPAANLGIKDRGRLAAGAFADVVIFDPATIADHSTYDKPMQLATGVSQVFVNGVQVLKDGQPTGAPAGRFVKGPGAGKCT
ncbi:N-acyl-D-amino-acid deacylase family protein [Glacieibacterium sp.]|uniref:N-acyl-D-amino-acid deacylase family protein n=1 Tax=Glacieibacterium sp. TaxID=2860237 RepID=UPI003AFF906D